VSAILDTADKAARCMLTCLQLDAEQGWSDEARRGKETQAERLDCFRAAQNKPWHITHHMLRRSATVMGDKAVL
jgi:hypothetical protein